MNNQSNAMPISETPDTSSNKSVHIINDRFTVQRITDQNEDGKEVFTDELFENGKSIFTNSSIDTKPEDIIARYEKLHAQMSDADREIQRYRTSSPKEQYKYWLRNAVMIAFNGGRMTGSESILVASMRYLEPQIDKYLPFIIRSLTQSMISEGIFDSEDEVLRAHFILDEEAKKHAKTPTIEGVTMSQPALVEKIGDLFYDSFSSILKELAQTAKSESSIANEIGENELSKSLSEAGAHLDAASGHIMKAWEICLPFISVNFQNLKHTHKVEETGVSNLELANRIGRLRYENLSSFLSLLSLKISKDGDADGARGRMKLSNELHSAAEEIAEAGKLLTK